MTCWENRETLNRLRAAVARIGRGAATCEVGPLPLGVSAIDAALGEGGLRRAALHEVSGPAAYGFTVVLAGRLAARHAGAVLWCMAPRGGCDLYPPGLVALGLDPARLLLVRCRDRPGLLAAAEEGLRGGGLAAVVVEGNRVPEMTAGRRLQLAAEDGGVTGLLLLRRGADRRHGAKASGAMAPEAAMLEVLSPSAAVSRWRVDHVPGDGGMRWRLALLRCRSGGVGEWMVDWDEKTHRLAMVSPAGH